MVPLIPRLLLCALLLGAAAPLRAAPALRYQVERRGDLVLLGNTAGFDCRASIPKPLVGAVDINGCGAATSDSEIDVLWRADDPAAGQARAGTDVTPAQARSTAVLALPPGARVAYARLYWAAAQAAGAQPGKTVVLERPGAFQAMVSADAQGQVDGASSYYQSSADVTELVQDLGPGALRVGAIPAASPVGIDSRLSFVAWSLLVFYDRAEDPPRNFTLFDGMDRIDDTRPAAAKLERFLVPASGGQGKLAVLAYEGDAETAGDRIRVGGQDLSDDLNPADNFFNGSRGLLGKAVTASGDLPQLSGQPGSMNGVDLDVVDVSSRLSAGAISIDVSATSSEDVYFLGALAGSVSTNKPILETELSYVNLTHPGTLVRPGDLLEFTLSVRNIGTDTALDVRGGWTAPPGLTYEPGSLRIARGAAQGPKTDTRGDDQGEFDPAGKALTVRLGEGASAQQGGRLPVNEPATLVRFRARVDMGQTGSVIRTGAGTSAAGEAGTMRGIPPMSWTSGDGKFPNRPVRIAVRECAQHSDCPAQAPRCDVVAGRCGNSCQRDMDCEGAATGALCLMSRCGCQKDSDCPSGACDVASGTCRIPQADLSVDVRFEPAPPSRGQPATEIVTVTNKGPDAAPGVEVLIPIPPGAKVHDGGLPPPGEGGWDCKQEDNLIRCRRAAPLPPGAAPDIRIVFDLPGDATSVDGSASVATPFAGDPDPSNNGVTRTTEISNDRWQLAGGGVGCALPGRGAAAAEGAALLTFALALLGFRRRRA